MLILTLTLRNHFHLRFHTQKLRFIGLSCEISLPYLIPPSSSSSDYLKISRIQASKLVVSIKGYMDLLFFKRHNVCVVLNTTDPKNADFIHVLDFLSNSNISFAISHNLPVLDNVEHIRATVHNQEVLLSEATIREVLHFNDNHEAPPDIEGDQQIEQNVEQPILEAPFMDQLLENREPVIEEQPAENIEAEVHDEVESSETLDEGIYGTKYDQSDYELEKDEQTVHPASSSKRPDDSKSDYELEEPLAKKIKTGLESLTSSSESLFDIPEHLTPTHSPTHIPPPSPQPSPQHTPVPTPPASPTPDLPPSVPRVKTLSLEVKRLQETVTKQDEVIENLNTELRECKEEVKDLKLEGETTSAGGPSSPAFVTNTQSALTIFTGQVAKTKDAMEVKIEETGYDLPSVSERRANRERGKEIESSVDVVILDEEEVGYDHELDELLKQVDDFGTIEDYPEIVTLKEEQGDKLKYFIEEGNEFDAPTYNDLEDQDVSDLYTPSVQASDPKRSWFKEMQAQEPPKHYEWFAEYEELKRPPVRWKYDKEHSLFIVRRYKGGVEHFKSPHDFSSNPKYDLRALAKLPLQNPRNVGIAKDFETFLRNQTFNDFRSMTTAKPRRVILKTRIHPRTQRPWEADKHRNYACVIDLLSDFRLKSGPTGTSMFDTFEKTWNTFMNIFICTIGSDAPGHGNLSKKGAKKTLEKTTTEPTKETKTESSFNGKKRNGRNFAIISPATPLAQVAPTTFNPNKKPYVATLPLCNTYQLHHTTNMTCRLCTTCGRSGHMANIFRVVPRVNQVYQPVVPTPTAITQGRACYECGDLNHFRNRCPRLVIVN
ncbi:hypothetical protein L1987_20413 [Smallanthus sonchifolius]|uniref:Uncharacterized protein n=1 Tax=Smallanthus sonchifolius TaxID=185202 RepID=A0ACB9ITG9_9ASTR|nr:hypothetical protein L1987_20413 [Smallanthus sonchifolius]